jgi:hypothetical protein
LVQINQSSSVFQVKSLVLNFIARFVLKFFFSKKSIFFQKKFQNNLLRKIALRHQNNGLFDSQTRPYSP